MASKAVKTAPEAISEESAKIQIADRPSEAQAVVLTTHADGTTAGTAPVVAGESSQDAERISPASTDEITSQPIPATSPQPGNDPSSVPAVDAPIPEPNSISHPSDQTAAVLTSEQANALFPVENYGAYTADALHGANLENFRESKHLHGKFTAHLYDRVLPAINESIKRLKEGDEINGFSGERQVGAYLESIGYTADLVRQWNKRYRERMAKLKKTLGLMGGNGDAKLTPEQRELRDTLIQQDYKKPEATRLAKAAEGNSVSERFNWVMAQRASEISGSGTDTTAEEPNSEPAPEATETSTATEPGSVTTVTDADAGELDEDNESDPAISSLEKEIALLTAENENLRQRLEALNAIPENLRDENVTATLAAEPDTFQAGEVLRIYFNTVGHRVLPPEMALGIINVTVKIGSRAHRIMPGDFLERRDKDGAPTLSKCVGIAEFMKRRRVQEWREGKWQKERVVFSEHEPEYRVINDQRAHVLAPAAFPASSPAKPSEEL